MKNIDIIKNNFTENQKVTIASETTLLNALNDATSILIKMLSNNGKLLACGNGGSSGDAQHISSEFINRFELEREELAAISLNSDTATLTSIANDYGYEYIFSKQIKAIGMDTDVLIAFTTSGNSKNIIEAIKAAHAKNMTVILMTGCDGGGAKKLLSDKDLPVIVPSNRTSRIQEVHLISIHSICECIDKYLTK